MVRPLIIGEVYDEIPYRLIKSNKWEREPIDRYWSAKEDMVFLGFQWYLLLMSALRIIIHTDITPGVTLMASDFN